MLSALRAGRCNHLPLGDDPDTHLCHRLTRPRDHGETERIESRKNRRYLIGNTTRDFVSFSAVPRPTVTPQYPPVSHTLHYSLVRDTRIFVQ